MSHLHPDGFACQECMDETATLRADLAKAREEVAVERRDNAAMAKVNSELMDRALAAERARDGWQEDARIYCQNAAHQSEQREAAERARDEAVAEVERLKEALEAIENATGLSPIAWTQGDILQAVMARARRALGRTDGEG